MKALLLFHLKSGIRVVVRSFAPLFSAMLAFLMLDINPAAAVTALASAVFAPQPAFGILAPTVMLAFLLPAWAVPKLLHGLTGWMRHLPTHEAGNRRGMALALITAQIPLALSLTCLAWVAHGRHANITVPSLRWLLVMVAGAVASLPVVRRFLTVPAACIAVLIAFQGDSRYLAPAAALLIAAEAASGPLRAMRRSDPRQAMDRLFSFRIAWRALGWRTSLICVAGLIPLAAAALFIRNNDLPFSLAAGAARLGGCVAAVVLMSGIADGLALRRPAWPLARSFPWSSSQRVLRDAAFLGSHALIPILILAAPYPGAALCVSGALPLLALRSADHLRLVRRRRLGSGRFAVEGFAVAALLSLLPWTTFLCLAAVPFAWVSARSSEQTLKVTGWSDRYHAAIGDPLSWSEE